MSESVRRRSSSRQLLENLIRVTAQRSLEDAEEVERERRRRAREKQRGGEERPSGSGPSQHNSLTVHNNTESDDELKPSCCLVLQDEDEGFSDWSHRLENRTELYDCRAKELRPSMLQWKPDNEKNDKCHPDQSSQASTSPPVEREKDDGKSYSMTGLLPPDSRRQHITCEPADTTSKLMAGTTKPQHGLCQVAGVMEQEQGDVQPALQRERRSSESRQSPADEAERRDLHLQMEEKHQQQGVEQKMPAERSVEDRNRSMDDMDRGSPFSSGEEPVNCYGPMSPTFKKLLIQFYPNEVKNSVSPHSQCTITERAESLRKSTNNGMKSPTCGPVSKINKRLQQYTHALEVSSKEGRSGGQVLTDLTSSAEPVASKKSLFEAGDTWNQNTISGTPSKDADGLRVGVSNLINQWVKGGEDGSGSSSTSQPAAEIKPGGVLNKKNLWESFNDTLAAGNDGKESSPGKRYKFVVMGHGKYEKVSPGDSCSEDTNWSAGQEDL